MSQIRLPESLQSIPSAFESMPGAIQRSSPRTRLIVGIVLLVAAIVGLRIWAGYSSADDRRMGERAVPVHVATVARGNLPVLEHAIGTVLANASVQVTSRIDGQVLSTGFQEGQIVHTGDLLFQIDPKPYQAALDQAEGAMRKDAAQYAAAARTAQRYEALAKEGAIADQLRDQNVADARALAATVAADKAAVDIAKLNLSYTRITAPIDGKTGPILVYPGNQVRASSAANSSGTPEQTSSQSGSSALVVINQIQPVKLSFSLPQSELPLIQKRMQAGALNVTAKIHGADSSGQTLTAPIDFVGNTVDQSTGTIELRATFPNADSRLVPGELLDVSVALSDVENAIVVPHDAVNLGQDGRYLFVVKDGKAQMVPITVLHDDGTKAAVRGKVKPGDTVVTEGQLRIVPGAPVQVVRAGSAAS